MAGDLNAQSPTQYILDGAVGSKDTGQSYKIIPVLGSPIPVLGMKVKQGKSVIWLFLGQPINDRIK